jgi:hypothetical protein
MIDTAKYKVEELRTMLVEDYGVSIDEVNALPAGKAAVVAKLRELESEDDAILEEALPETSVKVNGVEVEGREEMTWNDPNWTKWVLSQMAPDELQEGHPTLDGLRRITPIILVEDVAESSSEIAQVPTPDNHGHATVKVRLLLTNGYSVDGCADAGSNNCKGAYSLHPVAMAESRAESRAYRKMLRLKNVISAEEAVSPEEIIDQYETINATQEKMIDKTFSDLDINGVKWLATNDIKIENYKKITKSKASELCEKLNSLRASGSVPEEVKGYDFGWKL